jgi:hypothetical protein
VLLPPAIFTERGSKEGVACERSKTTASPYTWRHVQWVVRPFIATQFEQCQLCSQRSVRSPHAGHQPPRDASSVLGVAAARDEQSLFDDGSTDVAAADEHHDERVAHRKTL